MKKLLLLIAGAIIVAGAPATASGASTDDVAQAYPPPPPRGIELSVEVVCHESTPHIRYLAEPSGFTPSGSPTMSLAYSGTLEPVTVTGLEGLVNYPPAAYATTVTVTVGTDGVTASGQVGPVDAQCGEVSPPRSIEISAFSPICVNDAPFIDYKITTIGFTSSGRATITYFDKLGNFVSSVRVNQLSGTMLYPGATVDAQGNGTDWPGWKQTDTGEWVIDDSDAILRQGLVIRAEVDTPASDETATGAEPAGFRGVVAQASGNLTVEGTVAYPDATPQCSGPKQAVPTPPVGELPRTGSSNMTTIQVAAGLLVAGMIVLITARRRRLAASPS